MKKSELIKILNSFGWNPEIIIRSFEDDSDYWCCTKYLAENIFKDSNEDRVYIDTTVVPNYL